jgi:acyl dehydratase
MPVVKVSDIIALKGLEVGVSDWITVSQNRIDIFADCTEDHQFIHVDPERAAKETPFGGTIAHGFLSLALLSKLAYDVAISIDGAVMGINYGFDKVRFVQPVRAGKRIRSRFVLNDVIERKSGQWMITYGITAEIEGVEKPAFIAEWLTMQVLG